MKSQFVKELEEFAARLKKDGYPTAIVERAAVRMKQLEDLCLEYHREAEIDKIAKRSNN